MRSGLFEPAVRHGIESRLLNALRGQPELMSPRTAQSPRAAGDALERLVAELLEGALPRTCHTYSSSPSRRAMEDVSFLDETGNYYAVDVKTHRADTSFNMPNLTSVDRLARFYQESSNFFCILLVRYAVVDARVDVSEVLFAPIEFLDWNSLTLGALGRGQLQIRRVDRLRLRPDLSREEWMLEFCEQVLRFYPRELVKIAQRIEQFERLRTQWAALVEAARPAGQEDDE